ncbi:MAG: hypothetical protein CM15mP71_2740 [Candidatus Poseidoniales archaeon]|nr:MAG: hypothetical protein CM15mP71_2740 [Candidatus Poseidoniales archaeon]
MQFFQTKDQTDGESFPFDKVHKTPIGACTSLGFKKLE